MYLLPTYLPTYIPTAINLFFNSFKKMLDGIFQLCKMANFDCIKRQYVGESTLRWSILWHMWNAY